MSTLKKSLSIILAVLMLILSVPTGVFAADETDLLFKEISADLGVYDPDNCTPYERISFFRTGAAEFDGCMGNQLDGETKMFYDSIVEYYVTERKTGDYKYELSESIAFDVQIKKSEGNKIIDTNGDLSNTFAPLVFDASDAFVRDYPEIFWFRNSSYGYTGSITDIDMNEYNDPSLDIIDVEFTVTTVTYKPKEIYTGSSSDMAAFYAAADALVAEFDAHFKAKIPDYTRMDKLRYIHDYICANSAYDYDSLSDPNDHAAHSAQPFFIGDKLHVCEGYAKVLKIFCDRFGIPCVLISGSTKDIEYPNDRTKDGAHMWNYVQMEDGKWYLIDATWDDQETKIYDTYFIRCSESEGFYFERLADERYEKNTFSTYTSNGEQKVGRYFAYPEWSSEEYVPHEHSYTESVTEATCTTGGYTVYSCTCGEEYKTDEIAALGHDFAWVIDKGATCGADGKRHEKCSRCDATQSLDTVIPATGNHSYTSEITTPATHLATGVETFTCSGCSATYTKTIEKLTEHTYTSETTAPTCTAQGYTTYTCACGYSYKDNYVDALGHSFGWIIDKEETCGADGKKHEKCSRCGATQSLDTVIPATGNHSYTSEITTPATHLTTGVETFTCSGCSATYTKTIEKLPEHTYTTETTAPTCTAQGFTTYTCACGNSYKADYVDALGHDYKSKVTTAPTCEGKGVETFTCANCGDSYTKEIAAKGHSYSKSVTAPTCTAQGYTTYTCACGDSYKADYVDALGHDYKSEVTTAPTCEGKGVETFTCANCGDSYTEDIAAKGHSIKNVAAKAPTCTDDGYKAYEYCENCSYTTYEKVTALGHSYSGKVTAPTCTDKGYTTYTCACGDSYKADYVDALGHDYKSEVTTAPTCEGKGVETFTCENCSDTYTKEIAAKGHSYSKSVTAPTCTAQGYTTYTCACGNSYKDNYVDALGHDYKSEVTTAPTCESKGVETFTCANCGDTYTKEIAALVHKYSSSVTTAPTCTTDGVKTFTCENCNDSYTETIKSEGHSIKQVGEKAPTCTQDGHEAYEYCENCDYTTYKAIVAEGHTYTTETTAPTCEGEGFTTYTCACGDSYVSDKVPSLGHSWSDWSQTKAPTCSEAGKQERSCSICRDTEEKEIPADKHTYTAQVTEVTCTTDGFTTYTCSVCGNGYTGDVVKAKGHIFGEWEVVKHSTCVELGFEKRSCINCDVSQINEIAKSGHELVTTVVAPTCTEKGYTIYDCKHCTHSYMSNYVNANGHTDADADSFCDICSSEIIIDPSENCSCMCHKTGFMGFIYKIVLFFWKLFKMNPVCECSVAHY